MSQQFTYIQVVQADLIFSFYLFNRFLCIIICNFFHQANIWYRPAYGLGAYPGTIQLLVFTLANIASVFSLLLGYYMYKYSDAYENIDEDHRDGEHREAAKHLEKFLRLFGAALMGSLILLFISLAVYITS